MTVKKSVLKMPVVKGSNGTAVLQRIRGISGILCILGFLLSYYAFHVETNKEKNHTYKAMCDISEHMSCSRAFTSRYGKGFGLLEILTGKNSFLNQPNSITGMIFYLLFLTIGELASTRAAQIQVLLAAISNVGSIYLAYILYFILYDFCVVCVSTYIVNAALLICSIYRLKYLSKSSVKKKV